MAIAVDRLQDLQILLPLHRHLPHHHLHNDLLHRPHVRHNETKCNIDIELYGNR